ncbi:helix-turn-helix domain-containing protein [Streptomyces sp. NPDC018036]|uniref:helix-turn-helix domain-containing protein n=1 Tax=Streptomyces sp. NPDC018036 TaxID=3365035 RepID=UPI0037882D8D
MTRSQGGGGGQPSGRETLAAELRRLKERSGLSFGRLAGKTHYSRSSWERFLNGKQLPTAVALEEFAAVMDADADFLLGLLAGAVEPPGAGSVTDSGAGSSVAVGGDGAGTGGGVAQGGSSATAPVAATAATAEPASVRTAAVQPVTPESVSVQGGPAQGVFREAESAQGGSVQGGFAEGVLARPASAQAVGAPSAPERSVAEGPVLVPVPVPSVVVPAVQVPSVAVQAVQVPSVAVPAGAVSSVAVQAGAVSSAEGPPAEVASTEVASAGVASGEVPAGARRQLALWDWKPGIRMAGLVVAGALVGSLATAFALGAAPFGGGSSPGATDPSPQAPRPSCSKDSCQRRDPQAMDCQWDATTARETWLRGMHIELRYSAACGAVWGRIESGAVGDSVTIRDKYDLELTATVRVDRDTYTGMLPVDSDAPPRTVTICGRIPKFHAMECSPEGSVEP